MVARSNSFKNNPDYDNFRNAVEKGYIVWLPYAKRLARQRGFTERDAEDFVHNLCVRLCERYLEGTFDFISIDLVIHYGYKTVNRGFVLIRSEDLELDENRDTVNTPKKVDPLPSRLAELIKKLAEKYYLVFVKYYLDGKSHKEIADELGIKKETSSKRLQRAREMIRQLICDDMPHQLRAIFLACICDNKSLKTFAAENAISLDEASSLLSKLYEYIDDHYNPWQFLD